MSDSLNPLSSKSRFKLANPSDPLSFQFSTLSLSDELSVYARKEDDEKKSLTLKFDNWLSLYAIPNKIVQTVKKISSGIPKCGFQCAIRCAIDTSISQMWSNVHVKEFIRLSSKFYSMPQTGDTKELYIGELIRSSSKLDIGGSRYNIKCGEDLKTRLDSLSKSVSMSTTDTASWCILSALLRPDNEIPDLYRREWEMKEKEIEGLLEMRVYTIRALIVTLPGGEDEDEKREQRG